MNNENGSKRKINLAEFHDLLGRLKIGTIVERGDHSNMFTGTIDGLPVTISFNFETLAGHIETHGPAGEEWTSSEKSS